MHASTMARRCARSAITLLMEHELRKVLLSVGFSKLEEASSYTTILVSFCHPRKPNRKNGSLGAWGWDQGRLGVGSGAPWREPGSGVRGLRRARAAPSNQAFAL